MKALNLGCGERFHPDWTNVDYSPSHPEVRVHDIHKGIPFADGMFDVVYLSHVLEHFSKAEGPRLLVECRRVLRQGGTIRVVVPDLECIARLYLDSLKQAATGDPGAEENYDWMMLELYDQTVREYSGGNMLEYFRQASLPNEKFVLQRAGGEFRRARNSHMRPPSAAEAQPKRRWNTTRVRQGLRNRFFKLWQGESEFRAWQLGRFRMAGEVHLWMYDRFSLGRALARAGFEKPDQMGALESRIPGWADFGLDTEPDGSTYKPDSLFMEAIKP